MKRKHEQITFREFDSYLKSNYPHLDLTWQEPEQDPPDWYLTLGNYIFAVEATSITDMVSIGHYEIPSPSVSNSLNDFINELEKRALESGILSGAYQINLAPIPNLNEHKEELADIFIEYIKETKNLNSADERSLGYIGNKEISILKIHNNKNYIAEAIRFGTKSESEAQDDLKKSLAHSLSSKVSKLDHISEPWVLLILDAYNYSHVSSWSEAIKLIPDKKEFAAIVRIDPPVTPSILWSSSMWSSL